MARLSQIEIETSLRRETLNPRIRSAFAGETVHRVAFPDGMRVYKLTHGEALDADGSVKVKERGHVTEWWFSYDECRARKRGAPALELRGTGQVLENAYRARSDLRTFLRARGAICFDWNTMTHLLVAVLRREAIGLIGLCSGQPFYEKPAARQAHAAQNLSFIGGEQQLYIPGLTPRDLSVEVFGGLDSGRG